MVIEGWYARQRHQTCCLMSVSHCSGPGKFSRQGYFVKKYLLDSTIYRRKGDELLCKTGWDFFQILKIETFVGYGFGNPWETHTKTSLM